MQQSFAFATAPPDEVDVERLEPIATAPGRRIVLGTCGYAYADWVGRFYPANLKPRDMLAYYAERFSAVEIDTSYYRVPTRATFANMALRTPEDFRFAVKLPGTLTHVPPEATCPLHEDASLLYENVGPLRAEGKLLALLMQFPNAFRPGPAASAHLERLRAAFPGVDLAAEFRHRAWQTHETLALLDALGIAWTNVDQPQFATLLRPASDVTGGIAYVRFHGRNAAQWWRPPHPDDRYTYRYAADELAPWAERLVEMSHGARETFAFFNNHKYANATVDARQLARLLAVRLAG